MSSHPETIVKDYCDLCLKEITGKLVRDRGSEMFKSLHFKCYLAIKKELVAFRRRIRGKEPWGE